MACGTLHGPLMSYHIIVRRVLECPKRQHLGASNSVGSVLIFLSITTKNRVLTPSTLMALEMLIVFINVTLGLASHLLTTYISKHYIRLAFLVIELEMFNGISITTK